MRVSFLPSTVAAIVAGFSLALTAAPHAFAQNPNNLVLFYDFDHQDATNQAPNVSGYDGTLANVTFSSGIARDGSGYAAVFDGSSGVTTDLNVLPAAMPANTIGGWFYLTDTFSSNGVQQLISADAGGYDRGVCIDMRRGLENSGSGAAQWSAFAGPDMGVMQSGITAQTGSWHFIASSYDAASEVLTLDVDGNFTTRNSVLFDGQFNTLALGYNPGFSNERFRGVADDVFVYNTVLSAAELDTIQNGGRQVILSGTSAPEPGSLGFITCGLVPGSVLMLRRRPRKS